MVYFRIHHLHRRLLNSLPTSLHDSNSLGLLDHWVRPMPPSDGINKSVSTCLVDVHTMFGSSFSSESESSDMLSPGFPDSSSEDLLWWRHVRWRKFFSCRKLAVEIESTSFENAITKASFAIRGMSECHKDSKNARTLIRIKSARCV